MILEAKDFFKMPTYWSSEDRLELVNCEIIRNDTLCYDYPARLDTVKVIYIDADGDVYDLVLDGC